jgi:Major Facilitator Superfamily
MGDNGAHAYSLMFLLGGLAGLFGVYLLAITPEPPMAAPQIRLHPFRLLAEPFHHPNFRRLIAFLAAWNFAVNLAAPFFAVYMLRTLGFAMSTVVALNVVSQLSNLSFLHVWGRLSDRFGSRSVLAITAPLFLFCLLAWSLTGLPWLARLLLPLLVVLHILMGIATAGVVLASGNIAMKLSPPPISRPTASSPRYPRAWLLSSAAPAPISSRPTSSAFPSTGKALQTASHSRRSTSTPGPSSSRWPSSWASTRCAFLPRSKRRAS